MTSAPLHVWVVPDLALVVCPPDPKPWNREFYDLYSQVFLKHDEKIREYGFVWVLSDELVLHLLGNEFPWSAVGEIEWVTELMIAFEEWRRTVELLPVEHYPNVQVEPDITPSYVSDGTKQAWLNVLADCAQEGVALSRIASSLQQPTTHLRVLLDRSALEHIIEIVRQIVEWDAVLAKVNPWFRHGLPQTGDYPYEPPKPWQWGQPFPKGERGIGFLDAKGRTWMWDREEEHWDVQDRRQRRGKYIRVTSKGRRLE